MSKNKLCQQQESFQRQEAGGFRATEIQTEAEERWQTWKHQDLYETYYLWPCCCFLLLFYPDGLQLDGARDESDVCSFLHQPTNPPIIVVLLHDRESRVGCMIDCIMSVALNVLTSGVINPKRSGSDRNDDLNAGMTLTSFMCRKSLVSKLMAAPWTGQSSSRAPQ